MHNLAEEIDNTRNSTNLVCRRIQKGRMLFNYIRNQCQPSASDFGTIAQFCKAGQISVLELIGHFKPCAQGKCDGNDNLASALAIIARHNVVVPFDPTMAKPMRSHLVFESGVYDGCFGGKLSV